MPGIPGPLPPTKPPKRVRVRKAPTSRVPGDNPSTAVIEYDPLAGKSPVEKKRQARQKTIERAYAATPKAYTKTHPDLAGQERIDPGAGIVRYGGKNEKEYNRSVRARAARQRRIEALLAAEPRLAPVSKAQFKHAQRFGYDPTNEAILRSTGMDPLFQASARATRLSPLARNWILGPSISQPGFDPRKPGEWVDAALLLPFGRPLKGAFAVGAGARAGAKALARGAEKETEYQIARRALLGRGAARAVDTTTRAEHAVEAAKAAAGAYYEGSGIAARAAGHVRWRGGALLGQHFWEPAARSRFGRGVEKATEAVRSRLPLRSAPIVQSTGQKTGEEIQSFVKTQTKILDYPARRLIKIGKKLDAAEQYALRIVAEGVGPLEQAQYHGGLAAELGTTHKASSVAHGIHSQRFEQAARYVHQAPDGTWHINANAPARLREAERLFGKSNSTRERLYEELNLLTPGQMQRRIQMPGSIIRGEDKLLEQIHANPIRAQVESELRAKTELTDGQIQDILDALDSESLSLMKMRGGDTPPDILYKNVEFFQAGGLPEHSVEHWLAQDPNIRLSSYRGAVQDEVTAARRWSNSSATKKNYLPKGYKTAKTLNRLYAELYDRVAEGIKWAQHWYRDSGAAILRHSGGDIDKADDLAALTAIYSPQQAVIPNIGLALRAHEEFIATGKITLGQPWQRARALDVMEGRDWRAGLEKDDAIKVRNFYGNLLKHIDQERMRARGFTGREVTADGWMGAAFKYGDNTQTAKLNPRQHEFIQSVTQKIADDLGIQPEEAQAAIWTSIKAEKDRWLKGLPKDQALERAGTHFESGLARKEHQVRIAFEAASTNIPEYSGWAPGVQQAFLNANADAVLESFQRNGLYAHLTDYGIGTWLDEAGNVQLNPAAALMVNVGNLPKGDFSLRSESITLYDALAATVGKNLKQDGAGWMRPMVPTSSRTHTAYEIVGDFSAEQRGAIASAVAEHGYITQTKDGIMAVRYDPDTILDGKDVQAWRAFSDAVEQAIRNNANDDFVSIRGVTHRGGYLGSGQYEEALGSGGRTLDSGGRPGLLGGLDSDLASATERVRADFISDPEGAASRWAASSGGGEGQVGRVRPSFDPTANYIFGENWRNPVGGTSQISISKSGSEIVPQYTTLHEWAHQVYDELPASKAGMLLEEARALGFDESSLEELLPTALEAYIINPNADFPPAMKSVLERLRTKILKEQKPLYEAEGSFPSAPNFPPEVMDLVDQLFNWSGFKDGRFYLMDKRGLPSSWRSPLSKINAYRHMHQVYTGHGRAQALSFQGRDPTTTHEYQGFLKKMGMFVGNATDSAGESGVKAARIGTLKTFKDEIMPLTTEIPHSVDDVAVKVDPSIDAPQELKRVMDMIRDFELDGRKINYGELKGIDFQAVMDLVDHSFPSELGGQRAEVVAARMIQDQIQQPIDNIRWISRDVLEGTTIFNNPRIIEGGLWLQRGGKTVDLVVNGIKAEMLWLNPAYYSMNFLGNLAMNLMQQGPFAILNLPKAAFLSHQLGEYWAGQIDYLMGEGVTRATAEFMWGGNPAQHGMNLIQEMASKLVDQVPRRAAWLHEARTLGLISEEDIIALLKGAEAGERQAIEHVHYITKRANDAIVDYERLSPLEKKIVSRGIFFYPWIKGATRYTMRFPLEHPVQSMAFAALYWRQQQEADQQLGTRPWYSYLETPGSMIPGMPDTVNRGGKEYPYVINPKQILTFTTPLEQARAIGGFITGAQNRQPLVETLTPVLQSAIEALAGRQSFNQQDQPQTLGSFLRGLAQPPAVIKKIEEIVRNEGVNPDRLYPRNEMDKILSLALGSLAPKPYNAEKGQWMGAGQRGKPPEQKQRENLKEFHDTFGMHPPEGIVRAYQSKADWEHALVEAHKKVKDLTDEQLAALKFELLVKYHPEFEGARKAVTEGLVSTKETSLIDSWIEKELGWNDLRSITEYKNKKKKALGKDVSVSGNIDVSNLPVVHNKDGSVSTVLSFSFEEDGLEVLIPTVYDGAHHTEAQAKARYHKTGLHLGKYKTIAAANAAAKSIHEGKGYGYG